MENKYTLNHKKNDERQMVLRISTNKTRGVIQSSASIGWEVKRDGWISTEHAVFEDYFKWVKPSVLLNRATEKNLKTIHQETVNQLPDILQEVKTKYNIDTLEVIQ